MTALSLSRSLSKSPISKNFHPPSSPLLAPTMAAAVSSPLCFFLFPFAAAAAPVPATAMSSLIDPIKDIEDPPAKAFARGIPMMMRAQSSHPLDPLFAAEISIAEATVRAAGVTPKVGDSMRFVEVVLLEPEKSIVALTDAYFPPFFNHHYFPEQKVVLSFQTSFLLGGLGLLSITK